MKNIAEVPVPKNLRKFLALITDQLFCIDDDIVVLTEPQLKKAKFSYDDTQFFLNAMNKRKLYSVMKRRYDFHFMPVPKKSETKERLLTSWNWQMMFSEKIIEVRYFIKIASRDMLYEFCGLPTEERKQRGKTTKNGFKTANAFVESRSQEGDEDHHLLMGDRSGQNEKAHMIVDGKTGEQRVEDNRGEPTDTAPQIETFLTFPDGKKIRTTRETVEEVHNGNSSPRPHLDIADFIISGGPEGQEASFNVINIGKESAMDIKYQLKADFYAPDIHKLMHLLPVGETTKHLTHARYSSTELSDKELQNVKLALYYKGPDGKHFESGRYLTQIPRADGKFNLELGDHY